MSLPLLFTVLSLYTSFFPTVAVLVSGARSLFVVFLPWRPILADLAHSLTVKYVSLRTASRSYSASWQRSRAIKDEHPDGPIPEAVPS